MGDNRPQTRSIAPKAPNDSTQTQPPAASNRGESPLYIPVGWFVAVGLGALAIGVITSYWVGAPLLVIALSISIGIIYWASRRGDLLVVSLALLMFWLPFIITFSRINISPQELATYLICVIAAVVDRRGIIAWVKRVLTTIPVAARFVIILFVLAVLQSILRIANPSLSTLFNSLRSIAIFPIILALLIAYAIYTRRCERILITAFFWGGALLAVYALTLRVWGIDIAQSTLAGRLGGESSFLVDWHPNNLSLYLAFSLSFFPALLLFTIRDEHVRSLRFWRLAAIVVATVIMLVAVWLTFSRGALAALVLSSVLALIFFICFGSPRQRLIGIGIIAAGVFGLGGFLLVKGTGSLGRYATLLNPSTLLADPNVSFRVELYNRAIQEGTAHPFTGLGIGQFSVGADVPFSPHNTYLDLWVTIGLIGLGAFVVLILMSLFAAVNSARQLLKSRSHNGAELALTLGFGSAMIAFLVQAFVETFDSEPRIAPIIWVLALAALAIQFRDSQSAQVTVAPASAGDVPEAMPGSVREMSPARAASVASQATSAKAGVWSASLSGTWMPSRRAQARQMRQMQEQRAAPVTVVLPAIERPWGFATGELPAIENLDDTVTDFKMQAIRKSNGATESPGALPEPPTEPATPATAEDAAAEDAVEVEEPMTSTAKRRSVAEGLLARTASGYIWNQIYSLWFFAVNFILSVIIVRGLSGKDYGIYAILSTIVSVLTFVFAFGIEDVATVFLPRVMAEQGQEVAGRLVRRFTVLRIVVMVVVGLIFTFGLKFAVPALEHLGALPHGFSQSISGFHGLRPALMALYLGASSLVTLLTAFFVAVMRSRLTLIVGGLSQLAMVLLTWPLLKLGFGIDAIFAVQGAVALVTAFVYIFQLMPLLRSRTRNGVADGKGLRKMMVSAWLTNVTNGALGKQMDIVLMSLFAVNIVFIGYYNLAYQLANIVSVLMISGLGGVGMASMSAALAAGGPKRLANMWNASLMMQILLSVPLQIVTFVLADQIISVVYKPEDLGAVSLLRIYVAFGILGRFIGGGANQSTLYVLGRQRAVVVTRGAGLILNVILDVIFIQVAGPAGAMFATGFSQAWVGMIEYLLMRPHIPVRYPVDFCIRTLGVCALPTVIVLWLPTGGGLIGLAARCTVWLVLFIIGIMIFGLGNADDLTDMFNANPKLRRIINAVARRLPAALTQRGKQQAGVGASRA